MPMAARPAAVRSVISAQGRPASASAADTLALPADQTVLYLIPVGHIP